MNENINKFVSMIMEEVSLKDYTTEDFVDVYITIFKNWIKEKYGEQEIKYPFSYLKKKYEDEFFKFYDLRKVTYGGQYTMMANAGKEFVEMSLHSYDQVPSTDSSWFDKSINQRTWKAIEDKFKFPSYMNVEVVETRPRNLELDINVNFLDYIKSTESNPYPTGYQLITEIQKFMKKYGGVKFGNPLHGDLKLTERFYRFNGEEDWFNTAFKKEIKPKLKKEVNSRAYRGLKYEIKNGKPTITVLFTGYSCSDKDEAHEEVRKIIRDLGYTNNLIIKKS